MTTLSTVAYVFPGQGAQNIGMGLDLYNKYPSAKEVFDEADATLGFPLSKLCFEGPQEELTKTNNVQPAILATSVACLKAAREASNNSLPFPSFVAGHSLGEYTALVVANVLSIPDAIKLVRERGRLMYEAGLKNPGAMLAVIGLDEEAVKDICYRSKTEISNVNCPGQIVISGTNSSLAEASKLAKMKGTCRLISLQVSGAFHSTLMEPIMDEFNELVSSFMFHPPETTIIANVTAQPMTDVDSIKEELVKQVRSCILWQRSIEYMLNAGITTFYEVGPGQVLSGLIKRINSQLKVFNISKVEDIAQQTAQEIPIN